MKPAIIAGLTAGLLATASPVHHKTPNYSCPAHAVHNGNNVSVIFFSDDACTTTVPSTIYTRNVSSSVPCYNNYNTQTYNSLLILHIDDQLIGTNSALQVGNTNEGCVHRKPGQQCDFTKSVKFSVANQDLVHQCQFIGIDQGQGKPLLGGNEYRLTTLEG